MKTLKLFNAVVAKPTATTDPFISDQGFIIVPSALWAKDRIIDFWTRETLNGNDLNKTFHKSWKKIKDSSRLELYVHQIMHYLSTYGSNFQAEVYIPQEVLDIPDTKLVYKVIRAYSKEEMGEKCLNLLRSGMALAEETVDDLLSILSDGLEYEFTGREGIRNKEAIVKLAEDFGVLPDDPVEFLRYIVYRTTGETLLIKNPHLITLIKESSFNPKSAFKKYGYERLAEIFNRFKPLFLAYKNRCPKAINKISKLSKTHHKPLVSNALSEATQRLLTKDDVHWLDNATPFALFKALSACYSRSLGQNAFAYRIRNGKSWVKEAPRADFDINDQNYSFIIKYLRTKRYKDSFKGMKIFLPEDVTYALPISEKMFVGNIPSGTRFTGKRLAVGIYWKNGWGARDLDLSGISIGGKVGWNADYKAGALLFSGDITDAPDGAVEYLYADKGLREPTLVINNVYSGREDSGYKIIIGRGDKVSKEYMMNPNNLFAAIRCESVQKQMILGILDPIKEGVQTFVVLNFGAGSFHVSYNSELSRMTISALYQQWRSPVSFKHLMLSLGAKVVSDPAEADLDLSLDKLEKDSFIKLFS